MSKPVELFSELQIKNRIVELGKKITSDYDNKEIICISILKGSFIFMADLIREINLDTSCEFMVVSSYGSKTVSSGNVKIILDLKVDIKDKHVLIIEDIIDSGATIAHLMSVLKERKPASIEVCSLLIRKADKPAYIPKYFGFEIATVDFVIGYGLDANEKFRSMKYIGLLNP
ncbi:MAG: hypoxanthine phosphoribosyltransferase [Edafosvirus sp.]|uniref:hypoxanthine phosphoribosyltransferase n=1 Tax=Edafosvirus sp. TaxID=2487765 RepID=A0A3G4ZYD3_9VIRU|nr:MAG: hypoxanthine phosphoribosyltransferase [Edafosvirus sp.]